MIFKAYQAHWLAFCFIVIKFIDRYIVKKKKRKAKKIIMPVKQNSTLCYLLDEDQVKCIAKANDVISNSEE